MGNTADMTPHELNDRLKSELTGLFNYVQRVRKEIAAIQRPVQDEHQIEQMADQLDAIVGATEEATNTIMGMVEKNEAVLDKVRAALPDDKQALADAISANNMEIFQACSFQDITGQRVSKVLKSVRYVEDRVNALIQIWGKDALKHVDVGADTRTNDEKLLQGPALPADTSISQDEIDKLFE